MHYLPELYYFFDSKEIRGKNFQNLIIVIAKNVAQYCNCYSAKLLSPRKGVREIKKGGSLPTDRKEKEIFLEGLLKWIFDNSESIDLFSLFLQNGPIHTNRQGVIKFDHHDDTCCWILHLSGQEFKQLQKDLRKNNMPEDLFYEESEGKSISTKPGTFIRKFFRVLGFTSRKYYTPKQWVIQKGMENSEAN